MAWAVAAFATLARVLADRSTNARATVHMRLPGMRCNQPRRSSSRQMRWAVGVGKSSCSANAWSGAARRRATASKTAITLAAGESSFAFGLRAIGSSQEIVALIAAQDELDPIG